MSFWLCGFVSHWERCFQQQCHPSPYCHRKMSIFVDGCCSQNATPVSAFTVIHLSVGAWELSAALYLSLSFVDLGRNSWASDTPASVYCANHPISQFNKYDFGLSARAVSILLIDSWCIMTVPYSAAEILCLLHKGISYQVCIDWKKVDGLTKMDYLLICALHFSASLWNYSSSGGIKIKSQLSLRSPSLHKSIQMCFSRCYYFSIKWFERVCGEKQKRHAGRLHVQPSIQ